MEKNKTDYYSLPQLSNSALNHFAISPKHYLWYKQNPPAPTPAMVFGQAFHCYILEPEKFKESFFVLDTNNRPEKDKTMASNLNKEWKAGMIAANIKKTQIDSDDFEKLGAMKKSLMLHVGASELILQVTVTEKEIFWRDKVSGIDMKGKLDGYFTNNIIDLKTCQSAEPVGFVTHAINYAYHRQAALYIDGCRANKLQAANFYFIAIEKEPPYAVSVLNTSNEFERLGRNSYQRLLEDFAYWQQLGEPDIGYEWKNPIDTIFETELPQWIKNKV